MPVNVGDATLEFLADTQQLDAGFSAIGPKAQAAVVPAQAAMSNLGDSMDSAGAQGQEAFKKVGQSARGATEQVRFLGEETGVRLPRAIARMVGAAPGLSSAMNIAFNAVAVIFFAKMLADVTDKVSKFVASRIYHTAAIDDENRALAEEGKQIVSNIAAFKAARAELDKLQDTRKPIQVLNDTLKDQEDLYNRLAFKSGEFAHTTINEDNIRAVALREQIALTKEQIALQERADIEAHNEANLNFLKQEIGLRKDLAEVQILYNQSVHGLDSETADQMRYQISIKALQAQLAAEKKFGKDGIEVAAQINLQIEQLQAKHDQEMIDKAKQTQTSLRAETQTLLDGYALVTHESEISTTAQIDRMDQLAKAAGKLGITIKSDLVYAYSEAVRAQKEMIASGIANTAELEEATKAVKDAKTALDNFGKSQDEFKEKTKAAWTDFVHDVQSGKNAMAQVQFAGEQAFEGITKNVQGAFAAIVMGQGNVAKELEKAVASTLAGIAAQAAVKAIFYTAEGFAALAGFMPFSASQYFEAAGLMAGVAVTAGAAGRALSGGSGGGGGVNASNPNSKNQVFQYGSSSNNAGSQVSSGRSSVGVQGFAAGALITAPTLAMFAEQGPEVAMPLNDPTAMATIGKAVADAIRVQGGGGGINVHVKGMISPDNLAKVTKKISRAVGRGQATLTASNSMRVTRRSS